MAYVDGGCRPEGDREVGGAILVVIHRDWNAGPHGPLETSQEVGIWFLDWRDERHHLARESEGRTVQELRWGGVGVLAPGCPDSQQCHRKFVHP